MFRLFRFLHRIRYFLFFLFLEVICWWLFISYNRRYNTYYLNSSNAVAGQVSLAVTRASNFIELGEINKSLADENAKLRQLLADKNQRLPAPFFALDSAVTFYPAEVVNASYRYRHNYLTLQIDPLDSLKPGMGVMTGDGVVGRIKSVSRHFATVTSLLDPDLLLSARNTTTRVLCTVQWEGGDPRIASLKFYPRHQNLTKGDTLVTSGFNTVYPADIPIGIVEEVDILDEDAFYDATVRLFVDFTSLHFVQVVSVGLKDEKDSLQMEFAQ